jgi:hypothetical protein
MVIPDFILMAAQNGCDVVVQFKQERGYYFYIPTGAKSDLDIFLVEDNWVAIGRYNERYDISEWLDLVQAVSDCKCGRQYIANYWQKVIDIYL